MSWKNILKIDYTEARLLGNRYSPDDMEEYNKKDIPNKILEILSPIHYTKDYAKELIRESEHKFKWGLTNHPMQQLIDNMEVRYSSGGIDGGNRGDKVWEKAMKDLKDLRDGTRDYKEWGN